MIQSHLLRRYYSPGLVVRRNDAAETRPTCLGLTVLAASMLLLAGSERLDAWRPVAPVVLTG